MRRNRPLASSYRHLDNMRTPPEIISFARRNSLDEGKGSRMLSLPHQNDPWDKKDDNFSMKKFNQLVEKEKKKVARQTKKKRGAKGDETIETPRDAGNEGWVEKVFEGMSTLNEDFRKIGIDSTHETRMKFVHFEYADAKFEAARKIIQTKPEHLRKQLEMLERKEIPGNIEAVEDIKKKDKKEIALAEERIKNPGPYTSVVQKKIISEQLAEEVRPKTADQSSTQSKPKQEDLYDPKVVKELIKTSMKDMVLTEKLLYDVRYDTAWKPRYTKMLRENDKKKPVANKAGWVLPLQGLCDKIGVNSDFFTKNRKVGLADARAFILHQRLSRIQEPTDWLMGDKLSYMNQELEEFFKMGCDSDRIIERIDAFMQNVEDDRDRVRLQDLYYNNIVMWKGWFGSRKQVFVRTTIGGMERRFEILDNQVNHIVFTHEAFDDHLDLCRNKRIKCRDSTRVVLRYPTNADHDFIHANYVQGGPLFNKFIITQAPMENTIGDFWRMVWQEKSPYIFMLISRKEPARCAHYWPRKIGDEMSYCGLTIINRGIDEFHAHLFRITKLEMRGPGGEEFHVEHWQGDMNNSDDVVLPLQLLRLARNCSRPTIIHCHLGISRSATLVAAEICISSLLKGPSYKHCVQKAVQFLRSQRPFSIETPMQYIFVHRVVQHFLRDFTHVENRSIYSDYKQWITARATRPFIDDADQPIPGYRLLSPRIDPDLIGLVRHRERPDHRRETHDCVGQMPIPLEDNPEKRFEELQLTKCYPRGSRYD